MSNVFPKVLGNKNTVRGLNVAVPMQLAAANLDDIGGTESQAYREKLMRNARPGAVPASDTAGLYNISRESGQRQTQQQPQQQTQQPQQPTYSGVDADEIIRRVGASRQNRGMGMGMGGPMRGF